MNTPDKITKLKENEVMVFGSNLAGRHGKGAAKDALKFGALNGCCAGHFGQTYAIPTKDRQLATLPLDEIRDFVDDFLDYAYSMPSLTFLVTPIGCGLAGYKPADIAPMFQHRTPNVILPKSFEI